MKASLDGNRWTIDWKSILGPLASPGTGLDLTELSDLDRAARNFSRRAVRLRPEIPAGELPFVTEPVAWFDRGRLVSDPQVRPGTFQHFFAGDYFIQDAGSMLPIALAAIEPGQRVCDVCAAPGGKSTALAEQLGGQGILVANEVIRSRLSILELVLARSGYGNHVILNLDVEELVALCGDPFDCVLVDAPCTGQSMVAKGKQSHAAYARHQIDHSAARQRRIIQAAAKLVRPGGRVVDSTCTFSYAENEGVVQWLMDQLEGWLPVVDARLAAWSSQLPGTYRLWPHRDDCAGGFAAAFIRPLDCGAAGWWLAGNSNALAQTSPHKQCRWAPGCFPEMDPTIFAAEHQLGQWRTRADGSIHRFSIDMPPPWIDAAYAGVAIAHRRAGVWTPSYPSSVLAGTILSARQCADLSDSEVLRFVAGESIRHAGKEDGWASVSWRSRPLSWGKHVGGTLKNHLPKQLRQSGGMLG